MVNRHQYDRKTQMRFLCLIALSHSTPHLKIGDEHMYRDLSYSNCKYFGKRARYTFHSTTLYNWVPLLCQQSPEHVWPLLWNHPPSN